MRLDKILILIMVLTPLIPISAQKQKPVKKKTPVVKPTGNSSTGNSSVSDSDIASGLKEALSKGVKTAVDSLGRENGFLYYTPLRSEERRGV